MLFFVFFLIICRISLSMVSGDWDYTKNDSDKELVQIFSDKNNIIPHRILNKRADETLNLTCVVDDSDGHKYSLIWNLPRSSKNSKTRVSPLIVPFNERENSVDLIVQNLQESDTGDYRCDVLSNQNLTLYSASITVIVKKKVCGDKFFTCSQGCIPQRYVCDGYRDCKNGEDETELNCGANPCQGKITCENRCIPMSWCCQPYNEANCTVKMTPSCCQRLSKSYIEHDPGYVSDQQRFSDINFLQTTIYTVIGCAMAFMLIVTILVIAICRVHMKRSLLTQYPPGSVGLTSGLSARPNVHHHLQGEQRIPFYDLDVFLNRSPGLLVTYNINNGVQFVGHPVEPPPYCEVVACPPREGPPPPYASREDLETEALLQKPSSSNDVLDSDEGTTNVENICSSTPSTSQSTFIIK